MTDFEAIAAAALALPEEQREDLLERLLVSLDGPAYEDVEQAWDAEIARRLEEVESGKEKGIPWRKSGANSGKMPMVMPVEYHALAQAEVRSVRRYYGRAGAGLSTRFLTALDDAIARVAANPSTWPRGTYGTRSCLLRKFPYRLVYVEQPTRVFVLAVAHNRRRQSYWRRRLPP